MKVLLRSRTCIFSLALVALVISQRATSNQELDPKMPHVCRDRRKVTKQELVQTSVNVTKEFRTHIKSDRCPQWCVEMKNITNQELVKTWVPITEYVDTYVCCPGWQQVNNNEKGCTKREYYLCPFYRHKNDKDGVI
ncbi:uncharacterized protein TRIADDRAFT_57547 [Trichoplax adhaerens]|uniref:EMI domain-containing protein n=1 Tax=Trichoplax adhaerens TaxID=10228 RepID=B3RZR2_TRIAD|nr:hypothetical protein TRIADDRAFT_57547 [Trichoplax adhaerens]EDV24252.1 hypothetical protein TRIADDRAFT_57547 [Trichoplax adhaerens]|eukprot:XP_002113778.1 hypothetical protein TRIADDRAFT_57547 [Trichoplax adhaerens]